MKIIIATLTICLLILGWGYLSTTSSFNYEMNRITELKEERNQLEMENKNKETTLNQLLKDIQEVENKTEYIFVAEECEQPATTTCQEKICNCNSEELQILSLNQELDDALSRISHYVELISNCNNERATALNTIEELKDELININRIYRIKTSITN